MILNTKTKTITPEGETFGEIYQELQKMRPDDWKEFTLAPTIVTVEKWTTYPVYPDTTPWNPYAPNPYPIVTWCGSDSITCSKFEGDMTHTEVKPPYTLTNLTPNNLWKTYET